MTHSAPRPAALWSCPQRIIPMGKAQKGVKEDTHFGEKTVPLADKQGLVDDVFHSVARRYDLMNDLMSAGLHRTWKDALVTAVNPPKGDKAFALLDLAGGTGDVAFRVVEAGGQIEQGKRLIAFWRIDRRNQRILPG